MSWQELGEEMGVLSVYTKGLGNKGTEYPGHRTQGGYVCFGSGHALGTKQWFSSSFQLG